MGDVLAETPDRLAEPPDAAPVRRRTVLYVHGFDPRGPAPYHRLFAAEAAKQAAVSGTEIAVSPWKRDGPERAAWTVRARHGRVDTATTWEFVRWDGVVRRLWTRDGPRLVLQMWSAITVAWRSGLLGRSWRRARPLAFAMLLPVALTLTLQLAAVLVFALLAWASWLAAQSGAWRTLLCLVALAIMVPVPAAVWAWRRIDAVLRVSWLAQAVIVLAEAPRERRPEIREAADRIADRLVEAAATQGADEVLLVGHSYGAAVAVMALARALERDPAIGRRAGGPVVSFLTLGQSIAAWDQVAQGRRFHRDLEAVVRADHIVWLDVTSPSDGASSSWLDPTELVEHAAGRPIRRSPHFHLILSRARFRHIRMRPFDFHFQYLCAGERPGGFDLYRLACGPERLADFARAWTRFVEDRP